MSRSSPSAREGSLPAVDLHLMTAEPTAEERAAVDALLGAPTTGWDGGERTERDLRVAHAPEDNRTSLLPVLHALQGRVGWISEGGLNYACERLSVPPAEAYGVATFYAMFSVDAAARDRAARLRRPRLSHPRGRRHGGASRRRMRRRSQGGAEPLSRPVRGGAGGVVPGGGRGSHVPRRGAGRRRTRSLRRSTARGRSCRRPRWRRVTAGSGCCGVWARWIRRRCTTIARTAATPRWHARSSSDPTP